LGLFWNFYRNIFNMLLFLIDMQAEPTSPSFETFHLIIETILNELIENKQEELVSASYFTLDFTSSLNKIETYKQPEFRSVENFKRCLPQLYLFTSYLPLTVLLASLFLNNFLRTFYYFYLQKDEHSNKWQQCRPETVC
jgi:hypothetical protein